MFNEITIHLNTFESAHQLCVLIEKSYLPTEVSCGKYTVNGASLLGVLSLPTHNPCKVCITEGPLNEVVSLIDKIKELEESQLTRE